MENTFDRRQTPESKAPVEQLVRFLQMPQEEEEKMLTAYSEGMLSEMLAFLRPRLALLEQAHQQKVQARKQSEAVAADSYRQQAQSTPFSQTATSSTPFLLDGQFLLRMFQGIPQEHWKQLLQDFHSMPAADLEQALQVLKARMGMSDEQIGLLRQGLTELRQDVEKNGSEQLLRVLEQVSPEQLAEISQLHALDFNSGGRQKTRPSSERKQSDTGDYQAQIAREMQSLTSPQRARLIEIANEARRYDPQRRIDLLTEALEVFARLPVPCIQTNLYLERAGAYLQTLERNRPALTTATPLVEAGLRDCNEALAIHLPQEAFFFYAWGSMLRGTFYMLRGTVYNDKLVGIRQENLRQSLADFDRALQQISYETHPEIWTRACGSHALVSFELYKRGSRQELQGLALELETTIVKYFPSREKDAELRALLKAAEAQTYLQLYLFHTGEGKTLEQIVQDCDEALHVLTRDRYSDEWAALHQTRGYAYINRSQGDLEQNLEQAIADCQKALLVFQRANRPYEWAMTHLTLGYAYSRRVSGGKIENLKTSKHHYETSLQVLTHDAYPVEWQQVMAQYNTTMQELSRSDPGIAWRQEEPYAEAALEEAHFQERSVAWANAQVSQGDVYADRIQGNPLANKEQAIKHYDRALTVYTPGSTPSLWASTLLRRAIVKHRWFPPSLNEVAHTGGASPLQTIIDRLPGELLADMTTYRRYQDEAIADLEAALTVFTRESAPREWAVAHSELAAIYTAYVWSNSQEKIAEHLEASQSVFARENAPEMWAIHQVYRGNNLLFGSSELLSEQEARDALGYFDAALTVFTREVSPGEHRRIQLRRIQVLEYLEHWEEVHQALLSVREVQRDLVGRAIDEPNRSDSIGEITSDNIYVRDAQTLLRMDPPNTVEAVIALEEGRAQALRAELEIDAYEIRRPQFRNQETQKRFDAFFQAYRRWRAYQRQSTESFSPTLAISEEYEQQKQRLQLLQTAHKEFVQAQAAIRLHDDVDFMTPVPTLAGIAHALAGPEEALVYLVAGFYLPDRVQRVKRKEPIFSADPGMALVVTQHTDGTPEVWALSLPSMRSDAIDALLEPVSHAADAGEGGEASPGAEAHPRQRRVRLERALETLGDLGVNELAAVLYERGVHKMILVPYDRMGLFPLAAVRIRIPGRPVCALGDLFELTVVPNARAAEIARERATALSRRRQAFLFGGNPQPLAAGTDLPSTSLPFAAAEVETAYRLARAFGYPSACLHYLAPDKMKKDAVSARMQEVTYAHLALHGLYRANDPRRSVLILAGTQEISEEKRTISLGEVLDGEIDLHNLRLLVLSACETSTFDIRRLPNEVIGLAAGFLQAGVAGIIASLWQVDDEATYLLMTQFARLYLDSQGLWSPARALAQAQRWLREEATYRVLQQYDPLPAGVHAGTGSPLSHEGYDHQTALNHIRKNAAIHARRRPADLPYADPFYWAGFVVVGC